MKTYISTLVLTVGLSTLLGSSPVLAQSRSSATADIPFSFQANDTMLASGHYAVTHYTSSGGVFKLSNQDTQHSIFINGHAPSPGQDDPKVVFHRYGDRYYLAQVWINGTGYSLSKSRGEKKLPRRIYPNSWKHNRPRNGRRRSRLYLTRESSGPAACGRRNVDSRR